MPGNDVRPEYTTRATREPGVKPFAAYGVPDGVWDGVWDAVRVPVVIDAVAEFEGVTDGDPV